MNWKQIAQLDKSALFVLCDGNKELGFIHKPKDTRTDKNAWRVHLGIGEKKQNNWPRMDKKSGPKFVIAKHLTARNN